MSVNSAAFAPTSGGSRKLRSTSKIKGMGGVGGRGVSRRSNDDDGVGEEARIESVVVRFGDEALNREGLCHSSNA